LLGGARSEDTEKTQQTIKKYSPPPQKNKKINASLATSQNVYSAILTCTAAGAALICF